MHIPYVCVPWAQHLISLEIQNLPTTPFCWCAPTSPMKSQHSMFRSVAARLSGAHPARVERLSALRCVQTPIEAMLPHIHIPREHGRFLLHYGEAKCRPCMIRLRSAQSAPAVLPAPMLGRVARTAVTLADRPGWTKQSGAKRKKVGEQQPDSAAYRYYEFAHFGHNLSRRFATGSGGDISGAGTSSAPYASLTVILHQEYSPVRARHHSRRYLLVRKTLLRPLSSPAMRLVVSPTPGPGILRS